jgi:Domain of unknown function (DUF4337)
MGRPRGDERRLMLKTGNTMSEAHEAMEQAESAEHAVKEDKKIALLIAVLALFLAFSETLGKNAQTGAIRANVESANLWAFFQAKTIRRTVLNTAAEELKLDADRVNDPAAKAAIDAQVAVWLKNVARYESEPETGEGRKELSARALAQQEIGERSLTKYHHYELASAAFQIGIVLCSAAVITEMMWLAGISGALGIVGLVVLGFGLLAPHVLPLHFA